VGIEEELEAESLAFAREGQAQEILSNPLFVEACHAVESSILKGFGKSKRDAPQERERLFWELEGLKSVLKALHSVLNAGKIARERKSKRANGQSAEPS
jgi:hypothetical protein